MSSSFVLSCASFTVHWSLVVPVSTPVSTFYLCLQKCWCSLNQQLIYWVKSVKTVEQWEANIINPSSGQEEKIFVKKKIVTRFLDFSSVQCHTLTWSHSDTMVSCHHQTLSSRIRTKIVDIWYGIAHWEIIGGGQKYVNINSQLSFCSWSWQQMRL